MVERLDNLEDYVRRITEVIGFPVPLEDTKDDFVWNGADAHRPPNKPSPLSEKFQRKTVAPVLVLSSACIFIACRRLMNRCKVQPTVHIAEALFCFAVNPKHFNIDFTPVKLPRNTPELDASRELRVLVVKTVKTSQLKKLSSIPLLNIIPLLTFTRQIIGASNHDAFDAWLENAISRLDDLDSSVPLGARLADFESKDLYLLYKDKRFGTACSFESLDSDKSSNLEMDQRLVSEYLGSLSPIENTFLKNL